MSSSDSSSSSPSSSPTDRYAGITRGNDPSTTGCGTTPGSFARPAGIGTPWTFSSPDTPGMPPPSEKTAGDFLPPGWERTDDGVSAPAGFEPLTQLESARMGIITPEVERVAEREAHLSAVQIRDEIAAGRLIIPANRVHLEYTLDPMAIGRAATTKINANLGASPVTSSTDGELEKTEWSIRWGADTVMDLSTGGDLNATREAIIRASTVPVGTVPIYSMIIGRTIEDLTPDIILAELENQARQGVDFFTLHAGVLREHLEAVSNRQIGIVSRGGSLLARWMIHHGRQNPMYEMFDEICDVMRQYDVAFSLGDGLRPGGLSDATDEAQLRETDTLGELTERAWAKGCQVMIEGPGHIPFDQIEYNMKYQRRVCHGAPFYVLGPLVTDIFPGYDHITSCIGATAAAYHGAAILCYVTPKEHLGLPKPEDVKQGCIAYKIAAHAADVALGIPGSRDRDDELTRARAALNWNEHIRLSFDPETARAYREEDFCPDEDYCSMCGHDWCAVRISREIAMFNSGKDEEYSRQAEEVSRAVGVEQGKKPPCHSDATDPDTARAIQEQGAAEQAPEESGNS